MTESVIYKSTQMYQIRKIDSGLYLLDVLCGGIAMYEKTIALSNGEINTFHIDNNLDELASSVAHGLCDHRTVTWENNQLKRTNDRDGICDECGSPFHTNESKMVGLCPECAALIYNHEPCIHHIHNGECVACGWNGNRSPYTKKLHLAAQQGVQENRSR